MKKLINKQNKNSTVQSEVESTVQSTVDVDLTGFISNQQYTSELLNKKVDDVVEEFVETDEEIQQVKSDKEQILFDLLNDEEIDVESLLKEVGYVKLSAIQQVNKSNEQLTNMDKARTIWNEESKDGQVCPVRGVTIKRFLTEIGISKDCAGTYYQSLKKKGGWVVSK